MEQPQRFQAGDRVRTLAWIDVLPIDTKGIVIGNYPAADLYDVRFDGEHLVRLVCGRDLALVTRGVSQPSRQRARRLRSHLE